jgi:hemolysin activation/secretion protein
VSEHRVISSAPTTHFTRILLAAWLTAIAVCAHAQQPPTAGDVLRDLGDKAKPVPAPKAKPEIEVAPETRRAVKPLPAFKIDVKGFQFSGLSVVSESELQPLVQKYLGPDRTFEDLQGAANAVSQYLRDKGYFVAQAFLPEQKVQEGIIEIAVLEGRLAEVRIDMDERAPVSRSQVARLLATLTPGTVLHNDTVERALFLASDLRGITVRSLIEPGAAAGTANLVVKVEAARRIDGTIEFDNHGSRFTGEHRFGASMNINSPFGRGDLLSLRGLLGVPGGGEDTDFGRVSYIAPVGSYGTRIGAAYLKLRYHLGTGAFSALDQSGTSTVASVFAIHPVIRIRGVNLVAQGNFDVREFHDDRAAAGTESDRKIKAGSVAMQGDWRDALLGGGSNNFSLGVTRGDLDIQTPADRAADQGGGGRHTHGGYSKLNGAITRTNALTDAASVYVSYAFQMASKNLDGSEKVSLGGPSAVRAYAQGEGTADEAQLFTAEVRYGLPRIDFIPGNFVASLFFDYAHGKLNEDPLPADAGRNERTLRGLGIGLTFGSADNFFLRGTLAWRLSGPPTSDPVDRKPRLFFQAVKFL